jgi:hypothetical protein
MNEVQDSLKTTRDYINHFYSWDGRIQEWNQLLNGILAKKNRK